MNVRVVLRVAAIVAFAAVAYSGAVAWRAVQRPARIAAALPALPADLAAKSAELEKRVTAADTRARGSEGQLDAVAELGFLYHANGFLREAETCWSLLRNEQPRDGRWPYYLADLRRTAGDDTAVEELLAETVRLAPDYAAAWLKLADLEFKTGRMDRAEPRYRKRLELLPADPYARLGLARIAQQRENRSEARDLIEQIVLDTPGFSTAHNLLAEMLAAEGKAGEALRHRNLGRETGRYREADDPWLDEMHEWCFDPKRLALLSSMAYQAQRGDRGVALIERAAALAPDDPATLDLLGTLHLQLNEPAKAETAFARALQLPDTANRRVMLAVKLADALRMQRRYDEALRLVRDELARAPSAYELHNQLGATLADLGRIEESVAAYRRAVELVPNDTDSNYNLGAGLLALGRQEEGVRHVRQALVLQPTYPRALIVLGRMALEAGRLDEAFHYLKPLHDSHPRQAMARQLFAQYFLRAGEAAAARNDRAAAEQHYRAGLKVEPDHADLNAALGVHSLLQGRLNDALAPFEAFRRLRPEDPQSALFLGQLYAQLGRFAEARKVLTEGRDLAERTGNRATARHCREILEHLPPDSNGR